jgi:hypothetical protein
VAEFDRWKIHRRPDRGKRPQGLPGIAGVEIQACPKVDGAAHRWKVAAAANRNGAGRVLSRREGAISELCHRAFDMRYHVMTEVSPEDVLSRARDWFTGNARVEVEELGPDAIRVSGEIGTAEIRVDRHHGHTNVHANTDRVVGLDITDLTKRFLYTLGHV